MESKNRKMFTSILLLVVLFAGLITAVVLVRQRQIIEKKAAGGNATITSVTSVPTTVGNIFEVPIYINSTTATSGVDVVLDFSGSKSLISLDNIIVENTSTTFFKTYVPLKPSISPVPGYNPQDIFDVDKIKITANSTGIVEFGAVAFEWRANDPITPTPSPTTVPNFKWNGEKLATLRFKAGNTPGTAIITLVRKTKNSSETDNSTPNSTCTASQTGTYNCTSDSNVVEADSATDILTNSFTVNVTISPVAVSPTPTPTGGVVSNKRDVSGPNVGTPDGNVNSADVGFILKTPYPCGVDYDACEANTKRDISGSTVGTPDGNVNSADVGFILKTPYPCGVDYDACN